MKETGLIFTFVALLYDVGNLDNVVFTEHMDIRQTAAQS